MKETLVSLEKLEWKTIVNKLRTYAHHDQDDSLNRITDKLAEQLGMWVYQSDHYSKCSDSCCKEPMKTYADGEGRRFTVPE